MNYKKEEVSLDTLLDSMYSEAEQASISNYVYLKSLWKHRTIILNAEIGEDILEKVAMPLIEFEKDDSKEPVTLIISTVGGSLLHGFFLCDIIDGYSKPLNIVITNIALSMGFIIACAGAHNPNVKKYCYKHSFSLLHDGELALSGETGSTRDTMNWLESVDEDVRSYIINNTTITEAEYDAHKRKQGYMNAKDMKNYGVVDYVIDGRENRYAFS